MSLFTSIKELLQAIGIVKLALLGVALILMVAAVLLFPVVDWMKNFGEWSSRLGFAGAVIYGAVFGIAAILMVPCLPLTIFAGFAFGMFSGLVAVWIGIAIGAAFGFLFARYVARDAISKKFAQNDRFRSIDSAIAKEGWKIVGLLRLCPLPFGITNYLYGLTAVKFWPYMAATMIGILPPNIAFVYLGAFGKRTLDGPRHPLEYVLGGLAFLALVGVMLILRRIAQRATSAQLQPSA